MPARRVPPLPLSRLPLALLLLVLALLLPVSPPAHAAAPTLYPLGVGADLGPDPFTLGLTATAGDNPAGLRTGEQDGTPYWRTDTAAGTSYFAFDLDPEYTGSVSAGQLTAAVTYLDTGSGVLKLTGGPSEVLGSAALGDTGTWQTEAFTMPAAAATGELRLTGAAADGQPADITVSALRVTAGYSVDLGPTVDQHGITPRAGDNDSHLVTGTIDGRGYWQTDRSVPGAETGFFYMNVDDGQLYDNRDPVAVTIDYFDQGHGSMQLEYDSPGDTIPQMFKRSPTFTYGDSGGWKSHTFLLTDAILTNRSNGSDFRINTADLPGELRIARVTVTALPKTLDPTIGLKRLVAQADTTYAAAREGTRDGQYPPGAKAALKQATDAARTVANGTGVTDDQARAAFHALTAALDAFHALAVDTDIAHLGTATASSTAAGSDPGAAIDRNGGSAWVSGDGGDGETFTLDLGAGRRFDQVVATWGSPFASDYTVQVSTDGAHFRDVGRTGATGAGPAFTTAFPATTARYVRLAVSGYAAGADKVALAQLEVYDQRVVTPHPKLISTRYPTDDPVVADFDVRDHGADAGGRTDATAAVQAALYDCQDAGGGTVWMGAGTYRISTTVEIPPFCSLRGDRRDPDHGSGSYGTVISADLPPGADGPVLFRVGGSASVQGLTTYYPRQSATDPVPYNYTFEIPGRAWQGDQNYMMSSVAHVTMLDSYRGVGVSTLASDRGEPAVQGQVHESATLQDIKGTALSNGATAFNGADVGTWDQITFANSYWAGAPSAFRPPKRSVLDRWTRANGTGLVLGDLEWDQFSAISLSDYRTGIQVVKGQRAAFVGAFLQSTVVRTDVALQVDDIDTRWGMTLGASTLQGSVASIRNASGGYVKVTDTTLDGPTSGTVLELAGTVPRHHEPAAPPQPKRRVLYVAAGAPHGVGYQAADATAALQQVLDRAGAQGGGIVYLPAGWYRVEGGCGSRPGSNCAAPPPPRTATSAGPAPAPCSSPSPDATAPTPGRRPPSSPWTAPGRRAGPADLPPGEQPGRRLRALPVRPPGRRPRHLRRRCRPDQRLERHRHVLAPRRRLRGPQGQRRLPQPGDHRRRQRRRHRRGRAHQRQRGEPGRLRHPPLGPGRRCLRPDHRRLHQEEHRSGACGRRPGPHRLRRVRLWHAQRAGGRLRCRAGVQPRHRQPRRRRLHRRGRRARPGHRGQCAALQRRDLDRAGAAAQRHGDQHRGAVGDGERRARRRRRGADLRQRDLAGTL